MFAVSRSLPKVSAVFRPLPRQSFSTFFPFSSLNASTPTSSTSAEQTQSQVPHFSTTSTTTPTTTVKSVNKNDIIEEIANNHDLTKAASKRVLETVLDTIMEAVVEGRPVRVKGFGSFDSYMSKERMGTKPNTQEKIHIPSKRRIRFRASEAFKNM